MGGLQTAVGAAATAFGAPEFGIPLMTAGVGQVAGTGAGGTRGGSIGEMAGLAAGGLGEGFAGMGPMASTFSSAPQLQGLAQNPTVGAIPPENVNLPGGGTMKLPGLDAGSQPLLGQSAQALQQSLYPYATANNSIPNIGGSGNSGVLNFLSSPGGSALASSAMQAMKPPPPPQPPGAPQLRPQPTAAPVAPVQPTVANVPKPPGMPSSGGAPAQDPLQTLALLRLMGGTGA